MSTIVEELKSGLTFRALITGIISIPIINAVTIITTAYGGKPWTFSGFFIAPIYLLLLNEMLGSIRRSWRLSPQELTILLIPFQLTIGGYTLASGTANEGVQFHWYNGFMASTVYLSVTEPYKSAIGNIIPKFMIPSTEIAVKQAYFGVSLGETIDWSAWFTPVTYWTVIWIITSGVLPVLWLVLFRKPLIEIEKVHWAVQVPMNAALVHFTDIDNKTNRSRIFDMRSTWNKTFWLFILMGMICGFIPILTEVIPILPIGAWWGTYRLDFTSFTAAVMPGSLWFCTYEIQAQGIMFFLPTDMLTSFIFAWFVFNVLYPYIGIQAGFLPYEPGVETYTPWYYGFRPPFPYYIMLASGAVLGIGIWTFVGAWSHLKEAFSGHNDQGVNLRNVYIAIFALNIVLIAIFLGSGMPILPALILLVTWQIWQVSNMRSVGENWFNHPPLADVSWQWLYGAGLSTNAWTDTIPTQSSSLFATMHLNSNITWWPLRFDCMHAGFAGAFYKIAEATKTKARDILIALVTFIVVGIISTTILHTWMTVHAGGFSMFPPYVQDETLQSNVYTSGFAPGYTMEMHIGWTVAGFIFVMVLYLLRMRFLVLRYFTNPVGLVQAGSVNADWCWLPAIIALAVKVLVVRVGGPKMLEERIVPAVSGFLIGFGIPMLVGGLFLLFSVAWPSYMTHYIP